MEYLKNTIYVLNKDGTPLMPMHSWGRVKLFLKEKKAVVVSRKPFTIRLTSQVSIPTVQYCLPGVDPGRTNVGLCVIDDQGRVLFASDVITRNKMVPKLMQTRKMHRQASGRGERDVRQRRAIASDKTGLARQVEFWRMLTGCDRPICCRVIRNTPARFNHRKRPAGWRTPTAEHLYRQS